MAGGGVATSGNFTLNSSGIFVVGRNVTTLGIGSNLDLFNGSQFQVDGNLTTLNVGGNLVASSGGEVNVVGNLGILSVTGNIQGKGINDIVVGDDLSQLTVLGGGNGVPGLQGVNVVASTNVLGLDIRNGIANSKIQAGYLISGGTPGTGSNGWNIGPNVMNPAPIVDPGGQIAVLDSIIQAGDAIANVTIGGDVVSDRPSNPSSSLTRIIAGTALDGTLLPNGVIDAFQITGSLINSVLAASVGPNSSTGLYDKPAGAIEVGFLTTTPTSASASNTVKVQVGTSAAPIQNVGLIVSTPSGQTANSTQLAQLQNSPLPVATAPPFAGTTAMTPDPELTQVMPGGAINPSFAAKLQLVPPAAGAGSPLPLPTKSTVLGSVITTSAGGSDYAGIFAANTNGVIVGLLPTSSPVSPAAPSSD